MVGRMPPDRLEPRMPQRLDAALLRDLALEVVRLGAVGRQRGIALADHGARRPEGAAVVLREDREQPRAAHALRHAEERRDAPAGEHRLDDLGAEVLDRAPRHARPGNGATVPQADLVEAAHGAAPPRDRAASASTARSGPGT